MSRKKVDLIGEKNGVVEIIRERSVRGNRKLTIKCEICGTEKEIFHSQYSSGNWELCEHDIL